MTQSTLQDIGYFEKLLSKSINLYDPQKAEFYAQALYDRVNSYADLKQIEVFSFDVFDTLLLRNNKYELYRYLEISERVRELLEAKGLKHLSVWDIYTARLTAFRTCYRTVSPNCKIREGRLIDVLSLMAKILNLEVWIVPELVRVELTYEQENLSVNPFLQTFLNHENIRSKQIIFISDMYMSTEWIYQLVYKSYPDLKISKCYSSADYSLTKSSGLLYDLVVRDLKISRSVIVHMGDNLLADVLQAKKRGLKSIHLPIPEVYLKERKQEKEKFRSELVTQGFDLSLVY